MDGSSSNRDRLRDKIRAKREQRLGGTADVSSVDEDEEPPRLGANLGAEKRRELSRKVESELTRIFGGDPDAMKMAREFIDDPLSVLTQSTDGAMSPGEMETLERCIGSDAADEDEAPPRTKE